RTQISTRTLPEVCQRCVTIEEERGVMDAEIGEAAGCIWRYLAQHGETTLRQLLQGTPLQERMLFMGVGWLAREEKLRFIQQGRNLKLVLIEQTVYPSQARLHAACQLTKAA